MPRRVSLPGAAELFRTTPESQNGTASGPGSANGADRQVGEQPQPVKPAKPAPRGSGRVRHDEKITVYVSNDELLELERARLTLRAEHGMAVDRGRIVREALALALGDLSAHGADSELVRRLSQP